MVLQAMLTLDVLGWLGVVMIMLAHFGEAFVGSELRYRHSLSSAGAVFVAFACVKLGALHAAAINIVWMTIAVLALWRVGGNDGRREEGRHRRS